MRHEGKLTLAWVLLVVCVVACGGTQQATSALLPTPAPTPNIEATVEARVTEERAIEATIEAKAEAKAKVMVEATAQAVLPPTPIPATPTPTPTPAEKESELNIFDAIGEENVLAVQRHLDAGTNPDESFIPRGYPFDGASALHVAALVGNEEIVQLLIDNGANIEVKAKDESGGTPLQWVAFFGIDDMTEFLVNAGADINAEDNNGCTPLCAALIANPFVDEADIETFKNGRAAIVAFLEMRGAVETLDIETTVSLYKGDTPIEVEKITGSDNKGRTVIEVERVTGSDNKGGTVVGVEVRKGVSAEGAFADIFENATKVDRISIDDIKNCRVESTYDAKIGDIIEVEVALARREDGKSRSFNFRPHISHWLKRASEELSTRNFDLPFRIIGNPWNEANTGPYVVAVYRGITSVYPDTSEKFAIGDYIDNYGTIAPGTYKASLVEDTNISSYCKQLQLDIDVTNLIPDSVLIAWYVD